MARTSYIQTNFTAGELTPRMWGRPDVARYQNGAQTIENGVPSVHGGVERRGGFRFAAVAKLGGARRADIVSYSFNVDQSYLLEFGHQYIRFFSSTGAQLLDDSLAPLEIASPYTEDQVFEITRKQGGDTMFLFHPDVPTHRLRRLTSSQWVLDPVPWVAEPFAEIGHSPDARLTLSDPSVGTGRTFTTDPVAAPNAPTIGTAVALNGGARVHFTPPTDSGGSLITSYTATSSPDGITASGSGSPIFMTGLTNGVAYTFTVTATNVIGTSAPSAASNSVTPLASLPSENLTVSITPSNFYKETSNGTRTVTGPTALATGGSGPYSYLWERIGGSGIDLVNPKLATPSLRSTGYSATNYATLRCSVTDSSGAYGSQVCNVEIEHSSNPKFPEPIPE